MDSGVAHPQAAAAGGEAPAPRWNW